MGKSFNRKNRHFFSKEENDELEDDEIDDVELESSETEDDEVEEDESETAETEDDEVEEDESETAETEDEEVEDDEVEDDESETAETEDDEEEDDESESVETEDDEEDDNESETAETEEDEVEDDESESEEVEDNETEEDKLREVEENEAEDDEEMSLTDGDSEKGDRRSFRRKRRIKNQIIAYSIMTVILAVLIVVGVIVGNKVSDYVKEKRQAKELEAQLEKQQEELEQQEQHEQQEEKPAELVIETPPVDDIIEVPTPEEQLDEYINMCISEMPLEDRVASLFIVTPEALTGVNTVTQAGDATKEALSKYAVGGLVYFAKNIKSREQLTEMLSTTVSSSKYPIFLAVDEEGGSVSRIANSNIDVVKVDEMSVIGKSQDAVAAREAGTTIGTYLNELGFNLDFAPVADVVTDTENSVLGSRSFGTDAAVAADMVSNVVEGMQAAGVNACLKHFPGLGSAEEDTHEGRVETTRTLEEMRSSDFLPFQAGIEAGANVVMVSHVTASSVDAEGLPSSLSKVIITNVLRGELGFEGVVITDALNMSAITIYYTADEAAIMAIEAGADMLLMPENFETAYNGLLAAVQEGRISEERINESLRRIYRIKYADKIEQ